MLTEHDQRTGAGHRTPATARALSSGFGVIFACFFLSGATGPVYQLLWLRLLGLVFGHTVYAITAVLAAFMAGLALGSFVFARRLSRLPNLIRAYGGYGIVPDDLRMVINTFRSVFPSVTMWNTIRSDFLLVGRLEPTSIDLDRLRVRYQR